MDLESLTNAVAKSIASNPPFEEAIFVRDPRDGFWKWGWEEDGKATLMEGSPKWTDEGMALIMEAYERQRNSEDSQSHEQS